MSTDQKTFMFLVRNQGHVPELSPEEMQKVFAQWKKWIDGFRDSGRYIGGAPLEDTGRVISSPTGTTVIDGPFAESKEIVAGYLMFTAADYDEAVTWAKGCPVFDQAGKLELREVAIPLQQKVHGQV